MADGSIGCCLKGGAAFDGIQALAAENYGNERYRMLLQVSQEENGCKDCRYWFMCYGGCPGTGIDNDWRNRAKKCEAWKQLFSHIEKKIRVLMPNINTLPMFYPKVPSPLQVQASLGESGSTWSRAKRKNLEELKQQCKDSCDVRDKAHGDKPYGDKPYGDKPHGDKPHNHIPHGDKPYGDKPYGDKPHGDKPYGDS